MKIWNSVYISSLLNFFIGHMPFSTFFLLFKKFFEHIKGPLSGLFYRTKKCRSEVLRIGAFSIHIWDRACFPFSISKFLWWNFSIDIARKGTLCIIYSMYLLQIDEVSIPSLPLSLSLSLLKPMTKKHRYYFYRLRTISYPIEWKRSFIDGCRGISN